MRRQSQERMFGMGQRRIIGCLLIILLGLLGCCLPNAGWAYGAYGFGPKHYPDTLQYGEGIYFAPYETPIYAEPNEAGTVIEQLKWGRGSRNLQVFSQVHQNYVSAQNTFVSYYPELDVALLPVVSENGEGWAEVMYDQRQKKTGWVKLSDATAVANEDKTPPHFGHFQTWLDFMRLNAKPNGIYWLEGVSQYQRLLRSAPDDAAKTVPITVVRDLKVKHVRGNWLLVEVRDFNHNTPLGWIRWRDDEGRLMVFTNFSGNKLPVMMTGF